MIIVSRYVTEITKEAIKNIKLEEGEFVPSSADIRLVRSNLAITQNDNGLVFFNDDETSVEVPFNVVNFSDRRLYLRCSDGCYYRFDSAASAVCENSGKIADNYKMSCIILKKIDALDEVDANVSTKAFNEALNYMFPVDTGIKELNGNNGKSRHIVRQFFKKAKEYEKLFSSSNPEEKKDDEKAREDLSFYRNQYCEMKKQRDVFLAQKLAIEKELEKLKEKKE